MFLIRPNSTVQYQADQEDPWEYVWVGFNGHDAPFLLNQAGFTQRQPILTRLNGDELAGKMLQIYENRGSQIHESTRMTGLLYEFLASLIGQVRPAGRQDDDPVISAVRTAADFAAGNYSRPITIAEMAAYAGVSRSALYRAFRRHLGVSPMQYVTRLRIERACVLLQNTGSSINSVARSVGFEDPLYFSRAFKAARGCSPGKFRTIERQ